jgi:hypothetical protein
VAVFHHFELVHSKPVVVVWMVEVKDPCLRPSDRAILSPELHRHAIYEHPMKGVIALL